MACGSSENEESLEIFYSDDQSTTKDVEQALPAKSENMAKVVSIEDNNLTLILADMPEKPFEENASVPPSEQIQPSSSAGINKADSAEKPSLPLDKNLENLSFSGAEKTYTLSSDLVVTKGSPDSQTEVDLSNINPDSIIRFTISSSEDSKSVITNISVMD